MTSDVTERDVDDTEVSESERGDGTEGSTSGVAHGASGGGDHEEGPPGEPAAPPTGNGRSTAWVAWTVAAALALVAGFAVVQWRSIAGPAAEVRAARTAAVDYVQTLSTWDAGTGLEPTYAALVAGATEDFLPEVDEVFGDQQREELVAADAVSSGTINDVLTGEAGAGSVQVVVIVEQFVVTGPSADPALRSERVALLQMVEQDGSWLVDDLEMLSEIEIDEEEQG